MSRTAVVVIVLCCTPAAAGAQDAPLLRPGQVTVSAGGGVVGGYPIGDTTANLRRNTTTGTPPPFLLLRAESDIERAPGVDARVAVSLTRSLELEVAGSYAAPRLTVTISADDEAGGSATAGERLEQYAVDVSGVYLVPVSFGSRMRPYLIGGGGYLRQLHEGRVLVETGRTAHLGGGVRYWLRGGRANARALGLRGEVRGTRRSGAVEFEDQARTFFSASVLAFVGF